MSTAHAQGKPGVGVGIIGFGTIGTGVIRLLESNREEIRKRLGTTLDLVRVADLDIRRSRGVRLSRRLLTTDAEALIADPRVDVVVELMGGYEPARRFVLDAIHRGKGVVTANKALLAVHGRDVFAAAEAAGTDIGFEASVGGGIPILRTLREALAGDRNEAIFGIVNGTSNYILSNMAAESLDFETVLGVAQREGLAEADPTFDVDGIDAAHKLALLVRIGLGCDVDLGAIPVQGIRDVRPLDMAFAKDFGYAIKLLAIARRREKGIEARVQPTMVPVTHPLAGVDGAYNGISVEGEALGRSFYRGLGAGMMPTATAVVADLIDVARNLRAGCRGRVAPLGFPVGSLKKVGVLPMADLEGEYYVRLMAVDRPGVLGKISTILGRHEVSIGSLLQQEREHDSEVPIVLRTHACRERNLRRALVGIDALEAVRAPSIVLRMENDLGG